MLRYTVNDMAIGSELKKRFESAEKQPVTKYIREHNLHGAAAANVCRIARHLRMGVHIRGGIWVENEQPIFA